VHPENEGQGRGVKEQQVLTRVLGSTLALMSFAAVCLTGLLRGNSFASVIQSALLALLAGGIVGVLLAVVVRVVATEGFNRQFRQAKDQPPAPPAPDPAQPGASAKESPQAPAQQPVRTGPSKN